MMKKSLTIFTLCLLLGQSSAAKTPASNQGAQAIDSPTQTASLVEASKLNVQVIKLFSEGKYVEALPLATRVLEIREQALQPDNPLISSALINLASIHAELNKLDEAEKLYRRVLSINEKAGRSESEQSANVIYQLALICFNKKDYGQTDVLLKQSLAIREQILGPEHPDLVHLLLNIGQLYLSRDGFEKAKPFYVRAMNILQKAPPRKDAVSI